MSHTTFIISSDVEYFSAISHSSRFIKITRDYFSLTWINWFLSTFKYILMKQWVQEIQKMSYNIFFCRQNEAISTSCPERCRMRNFLWSCEKYFHLSDVSAFKIENKSWRILSIHSFTQNNEKIIMKYGKSQKDICKKKNLFTLLRCRQTKEFKIFAFFSYKNATIDQNEYFRNVTIFYSPIKKKKKIFLMKNCG